jgi:hypothetical protein
VFLAPPSIKKLNNVLESGDCGSWILEPSTGKVFGHIVAGLPGTNLAYVISAQHIIRNIESMTGSKVMLPSKRNVAAVTGTSVNVCDSIVRFLTAVQPLDLQA